MLCISLSFIFLVYQAATQQPETSADDGVDCSIGKYGTMKLIQSTGEFRDRKFTDVNQLNEQNAGKTIWVRGK